MADTSLIHRSANDWLANEFLKRRKKNPRYSLRSFAQKTGISSGRLSEILSGKRRLTARLCERVADGLLLSPEQRETLAQLLAKGRRAQVASVSPAFKPVNADVFKAIADWEHWALLSLLRTDDFHSDISWMAQRLGISVVEVRQALQRLLRLGLITREGSTYRRVSEHLTTTHEIPSAALKKSHVQSLKQAIACITDVPLELRDVTSVTMVIDPERLPEAKQLIREFRRQLAVIMENGAKKEIYNLNIQFVPVSKPQRSQKS